jgi:protein-disulfide isomerase-like protein with CxxC motif
MLPTIQTAHYTEGRQTMLHALINIAFSAVLIFAIWAIYYTVKGY